MPAELSAVNTLLRRWLVKLPSVSRSSAAWAIAADDNPLEFIVPAFETLWRVVAVAFAEAHGTEAWCAPFLSLATSTDVAPAAFREGTPSVDDFINEVLRLRPPTRRIERIWGGKSVKADVERAQRNPSIWGAHADEFDPLRPKTGELLAFGARPLKCPGATWAPQAAGILVAALLSEGLRLQRGMKLGGRDGWDDWRVTR
ncbi:hypothetical protein AURDEDRAFT_112611 [Auricularia subglabra TFB-10046 SS5]|nr:hypothetical protein AURDEDRAFT_112611 [Auricularia subglabra TFB-10046 SS5]